ncbi:hypothetical protein [Gehongia tenuis]|uniref:Uncharacterized protein n=1 Tax=Gehongia tenuis TaxID=2763655 RepID=A0A926D5U0_9FIRM|nr:hypothetical protein [Gehongia tenuis]MBC8531939.1 hypothetical protein [Gehongia tenuis]
MNVLESLGKGEMDDYELALSDLPRRWVTLKGRVYGVMMLEELGCTAKTAALLENYLEFYLGRDIRTTGLPRTAYYSKCSQHSDEMEYGLMRADTLEILSVYKLERCDDPERFDRAWKALWGKTEGNDS